MKEVDKTMNVMDYLSPTIEKLKNEYAKLFKGDMPKVSEPLRGISLPVGNDTEEIHASACAVRAYLGDHLPQIIKEFFKPSQCLALIERVKEIANQLSEIPEIGVPQHTNRCQCHLDYKEPKAKYQRKTMGLRILHNVNQWVKSFIEDFSPGGSSGRGVLIPNGEIPLAQQQIEGGKETRK
ncbi:unnamed protein product [Boreogadus saida]